MTVAVYCQKNAVLKREEGIGHPRNQSHASSATEGLLIGMEKSVDLPDCH
jgi:hypothetical protein